MAQLDNVLQKINKFITINDNDRGPYAADFDFIKNTIISKMREEDTIFLKLYKGCCLGGSYADNLKISKPDEYDLVLKLKLKEVQFVKIKKNPKLPGYCTINIIESMKKIETQTEHSDVYEHLKKLMTAEGFLIENKIQRWIEGLIAKIINKFDNKSIKSNDGKLYKLNYSKAGPAHTITVMQGNNKFSIDFVPAFIFDKTKWIAQRKLPADTPIYCQDWIAVPKPIKGDEQSMNTSFITSYVDSERHLIANKNSLKNTLKILKKLRDRKNLNNLKSYFIKTVYLWEKEVQTEIFWNGSTSSILLHMIDRLISYLEMENLPFFWDKSQNMFAKLSKNQILNILNEIKNAQKIITTYPDKIYDLFLTPEEKLELNNNSLCATMLNCNLIDTGNSIVENNNKIKKQQNTCKAIKPKKEADQKVIQIKEILKKYKNNSEKILFEIKKIVNDGKFDNNSNSANSKNSCTTF